MRTGVLLALVLAPVLLGPAVRAARPADDEHVAPGRIAWHPDVATAQARARATGRPVLHVQVLGRLDEVHC